MLLERTRNSSFWTVHGEEAKKAQVKFESLFSIRDPADVDPGTFK